MRIGQIVFVNDSNLPEIQTGIITRKERDEDAQCMWYEVLCNDGQNHVLPDYLLSPARRSYVTSSAKKCKKMSKFCASMYKNTKQPVKLYT